MPTHKHIICLDPIRLLQLAIYNFGHSLGLSLVQTNIISYW